MTARYLSTDTRRLHRHQSWHRPGDGGLTAINRRRERRAVRRWLLHIVRGWWR